MAREEQHTHMRARSATALACCVFVLSLAGCVASQSDMVKQEKDLTAKIAKARADLDQLVSETRARFNQELATLREEELPALRGSMDKGSNRFDSMQRRLDDVENKTSARLRVLEKIQHDQANLLKADRDRVQEELARLAETIGALAKTVDAKLEGHDKELASQTGQLAQLGRSMTELSARMEADAKVTAKHLAEVNKSVSSVSKALRTVGEAIETRDAEQERRLDEMAKAMQGMGAKAGTVKKGKSARNSKRAPRQDGAATASPKGAGQAAAGPVAAPVGATPDDDIKTYEQSLQAFKKGDFNVARKRFSDFLQRHPDSKLAGNAQYWLGECYYGVKDYGQAIEAFDRVHRSYPRSPKVPAALLKKGFAYMSLKDSRRASSTLKQVVETYPNTPEASMARQKLAQLQ